MNITFQRAQPDENFSIMRFESEDGRCEVGLSPVLFGVRVRAGDVGSMAVDIDYCAGADVLFQLQLLDVIKRIIETFPTGTPMRDIAAQLPTYERRPINQDPCWPALQQLLSERTGEKAAFQAGIEQMLGGESPASERDCCPNCGGTIVGDGYQSVRHCENADSEVYFHAEPDSDTVLCKPAEPHEIHEEVKLTAREIGRLRHALDDSRNLPSAYEILSDHGLMERTPNGFVSLDPQVIETRIRRLLGPTT